MKIQLKRIKPELYDDLTIATLSQNKEQLETLVKQNKGDLYELTEVELPDEFVVNRYEEIHFITTLLDKGLEEYEEGIYAGVVLGSLFQFDFKDKTVTFSIHLRDNYVFMLEAKRVWFASDVYRKNYIYANYETGEILKYLGEERLKEKVKSTFHYQNALKEILRCAQASSLEELFKYTVI